MCRYGFHTYKDHYLCFNCKKQFKQFKLSEKMGDDYSDYYRLDNKVNGRYQLPKWHKKYERNQVFTLNEVEQKRYDGYVKKYLNPVVCPQCRQPMMQTGLDTKAPKMSDKDAWEALEKTHKLGYTFGSCGCGGPGFIPSDKAEYREYLEKRLNEYETYYQKTLKEIVTNENEVENHSDSIYWAQLIDKIELAIKEIK